MNSLTFSIFLTLVIYGFISDTGTKISTTIVESDSTEEMYNASLARDLSWFDFFRMEEYEGKNTQL